VSDLTDATLAAKRLPEPTTSPNTCLLILSDSGWKGAKTIKRPKGAKTKPNQDKKLPFTSLYLTKTIQPELANPLIITTISPEPLHLQTLLSQLKEF
jgi:hypothetical protein